MREREKLRIERNIKGKNSKKMALPPFLFFGGPVMHLSEVNVVDRDI